MDPKWTDLTWNENTVLREELWRQWGVNHAEHCNVEWPHEGMECHWPLPDVLKGSRVAER